MTFSGPVTLSPVRLVKLNMLDPEVTPKASVTDEPPVVTLLLTLRLLAVPPPFRPAAPLMERGP